MSVTTLAYFVVLVRTWNWPLYKAIPLCGAFLAILRRPYVPCAANLRKFLDGGWVPFSIGVGVFVVFTTWMAGRKRLGARMVSNMVPLDAFLSDVERDAPPRVRGTAVFLTANLGGVPPLLRHHYKHNQVLHASDGAAHDLERAVAPFVPPSQRFEVTPIKLGFTRVRLPLRLHGDAGGAPDLPAGARRLHGLDIDLDPDDVLLSAATWTVILAGRARTDMARWRKRLFGFISRNAVSATAYFGIPPDRVVEKELGMQDRAVIHAEAAKAAPNPDLASLGRVAGEASRLSSSSRRATMRP